MELDQSLDIDQIASAAEEAARRACQTLLSFYGRLSQVTEKESAGLVSEADKGAEKVIFDYLKEQFPKHHFLGEEQSFVEEAKPSDYEDKDDLWIIDPLDGTTNYVHQFPIWCTSIAYYHKGQPMVGVIYAPLLQERFVAVRGKGAFLNGEKLSVSSANELGQALAATGFFADNEREHKEQMAIFNDLVTKCRGVRRPGAAAYDLCMVAKGGFDFFWERNLKPWDSAAGLLLVQEAGGKVSTYRGEDFGPFKNSIIAGSTDLITKVQSVMEPHLLPETH